MSRSTLAVAAVSLVVLAGCSGTQAPEPVAASAMTSTITALDPSFLERFGLEGMQPRDIVDTLDQTNEDRNSDVMGSVRYDSVVFTTAQGEVTLPLEGDKFYLALAPYVDQTHDCYYHNLATCQGELVGEDLDVTITTDDGEVIVDETVTTYDNGFVGFWLPRDITGTIEVVHDGRSASAPIATGPEDPTCVTTLQLT